MSLASARREAASAGVSSGFRTHHARLSPFFDVLEKSIQLGRNTIPATSFLLGQYIDVNCPLI
jgi:hypothetical protein